MIRFWRIAGAVVALGFALLLIPSVPVLADDADTRHHGEHQQSSGSSTDSSDKLKKKTEELSGQLGDGSPKVEEDRNEHEHHHHHRDYDSDDYDEENGWDSFGSALGAHMARHIGFSVGYSALVRPIDETSDGLKSHTTGGLHATLETTLYRHRRSAVGLSLNYSGYQLVVTDGHDEMTTDFASLSMMLTYRHHLTRMAPRGPYAKLGAGVGGLIGGTTRLNGKSFGSLHYDRTTFTGQVGLGWSLTRNVFAETTYTYGCLRGNTLWGAALGMRF